MKKNAEVFGKAGRFLAVCFWMFSGSFLVSAAEPGVETQEKTEALREFSSVKIWNAAAHNAFTDLIEFRGAYYCTFRESSVGHIPGKTTGDGDGEVRILRSADGAHWESAALLRKKTFDLRDSKLSVTPDGRLMVLMGGSVYEKQQLVRRCTQVSFSDPEGKNFSEPQDVRMDPAIRTDLDWLWRVTWHEGIGYGALYQPLGSEWTLQLVKTKDGINYQHVAQLDVTGRPNETTVRFAPDGRMLLLVRREAGREKGTNSAWFGAAKAPFTAWTWTPIGEALGGPNFIFLPNGKILAGGRVKGKMGIGFLDEKPQFRLFSILPSGGDCSYPGFLIVGKELWVSYYAWSEIYLAKIPLEELN